MKKFLDEDFLLYTQTSRKLYHDYAAAMPIIDYHCHLPPDQIASDHQFENITRAWLYGDHYKWRAMRANGINEFYVTGKATDEEKFQKWAETVPYTLRNPLYHWTHLELQRYFNIHELLDGSSASNIYEETSKLLQTKEFSTQHLLRRMKVKVVCTTDDPLDDLQHHLHIRQTFPDVKVLPTFRPDKAMDFANNSGINNYIDRLEGVSGMSIANYDDYLTVLKQRHDYFATHGCLLSDHGLETIIAEDYTEDGVKNYFRRVRDGKDLSPSEQNQLKSALLYEFAQWDWEKGWVQQFHLGALRNNSSRLLAAFGADAGVDSIGDFSQAVSLSRFLNRLDSTNRLAKTILYNLNPADSELIATMAGNFNDGSVPGKIQYGSAWWFLDQKEGMIRQLNALSNMGLLSRFVGMLTDSRSFLSYPRHEYFRRILCNLLGEEMEKGELPYDLKWIGKIVQDICYHNAAGYFNWQVNEPQLSKEYE